MVNVMVAWVFSDAVRGMALSLHAIAVDGMQ
jgi:hypothetical protein